MLRLALTSHRAICIPPECGFAVWLWERYKDWSASFVADDLKAFVNDLIACRKFETWALTPEEITDALRTRRPANYTDVCDEVYRSYLRKNDGNAKRWGDKNNFHVTCIANIDRIFSDSQFIHIVRDVRDVVCSYRDLESLQTDSRYAPDLPIKIGAIAHQWSHNVQSVLNAFAQLNPARSIHVRYEDLVADPRRELIRLCEFMGESFDSEMLQFHRKSLEPDEMKAWKVLTDFPITNTRARRFEQDLDATQIKTTMSIAKPQMDVFNYF